MHWRFWCGSLLFVLGAMAIAAEGQDPAAAPTANEIVQRSVVNNQADWKAAPQYAYTETDNITKHGVTTHRTYRVLMIAGSPYHKLLAINSEPLSAAGAAAENRKLQRETHRRQTQGAGARQARIAKYEQGRRQDHELMQQMIKGFQYQLLGIETMDGRQCYAIRATPKPGYRPPNRDTKVLLGMRGELWIDTKAFQWVKVHAQVFRPVAFGLFIAHVQPGTEFTLEEAPIGGGLWEPVHFRTDVLATILHFWSRNSTEDDTYRDYKPMNSAPVTTASAARASNTHEQSD